MNISFVSLGVQPLRISADLPSRQEIINAYQTGQPSSIVGAQAKIYTCAKAAGFEFIEPTTVGLPSTSLVIAEPVRAFGGKQVGTHWMFEGGEDLFRLLAETGEVTVPCVGFSAVTLV